MQELMDFLLNNYIWFLIVSLIIIFALIGYLVDTTNNKEKKTKIKPIAKVVNDEVNIHPSVEAYTNEDFDEPLMK